jgi:hypothetical protein
VQVAGGPDDPPLVNGTRGLTTTAGTHWGGKISNGYAMNFYLGQIVGTSNYSPYSTGASWQLSSLVQMHAENATTNVPTGVHQSWEVGWNSDGSVPSGIMNCDHYQTLANVDGNYTSNVKSRFSPLVAGGSITGVSGLHAVVLRVHLYNDSPWSWTYDNIDNVTFAATCTTLPTPGDYTGDHHVDGADLDAFLACGSGPALGPPPLGCSWADLDGDNDVDGIDFGLLQRCYSGSSLTGNPNCTN